MIIQFSLASNHLTIGSELYSEGKNLRGCPCFLPIVLLKLYLKLINVSWYQIWEAPEAHLKLSLDVIGSKNALQLHHKFNLSIIFDFFNNT